MKKTSTLSRLKLTLSRTTMICAVGIALSAQAFAQSTDAQFQSAYPGRADQQVVTSEFAPKIQPKVDVRESKIAEAPAGAEKVTFQLDRLSVKGVTAYSQGEIERVYSDKLGTTITLADLYGIAADLTRKYRNDGYILTQVVVPAQTIENGEAKLRVIEGYIDQVSVTGEKSPAAEKLINEMAQRAHTDGAPLNTVDLEHTLLLINDLPGVKARSILSPSKTKTGAADLNIIIERKSYSGSVSIDNYGTRYLGPIQVGGSVSANSYFGMNETITAQLFTTPDVNDGMELYYGSLGYSVPWSATGTIFDLFYSNTNTDPGYTLDQFDVRGRSQYFSATVRHPFIRTRNLNLTGRVKYDMRNAKSSNNISVDPSRSDHIRALRLGGRFEYLDRFFNAGFNILDVELSQGLYVFGASSQGDSTLSRPAGDPGFTKLNVEYQRLQRVNSSVNVLLGLKGQLSNDAQLSSEEFGFGGKDYGRGYDPSEIVGDDGYAGKIELQWNQPYDLNFVDKYHVYTFFDAGRVWNNDPVTASQGIDTATSTGLGVRATFAEDVNAGLMVAYPLDRTVQTTGDQGPRIFFNLSKDF